VRVVAVDWSGRASGEQRAIWLAEVRDGELTRLEAGRTRDEVAEHVVALAADDPDLVVGFDSPFRSRSGSSTGSPTPSTTQ
jgi:hypothetical protein